MRYIHLNPVRVGAVNGLEDLDQYPWTGHSALVGVVNREWQDVDFVLGQFGRVAGEARARYREFVASGAEQGRREDLQGGGLVRSMVAGIGYWCCAAAESGGRMTSEFWAVASSLRGFGRRWRGRRARPHHERRRPDRLFGEATDERGQEVWTEGYRVERRKSETGGSGGERRSQLRGRPSRRTGADEARQAAASIEAEHFERGRDRRAGDDQKRAGAEALLVITDVSDLRPPGLRPVHPKKAVQCFGREAKEFTRRMAAGKKIQLQLDQANAATGHKDKYGPHPGIRLPRRRDILKCRNHPSGVWRRLHALSVPLSGRI